MPAETKIKLNFHDIQFATVACKISTQPWPNEHIFAVKFILVTTPSLVWPRIATAAHLQRTNGTSITNIPPTVRTLVVHRWYIRQAPKDSYKSTKSIVEKETKKETRKKKLY